MLLRTSTRSHRPYVRELHTTFKLLMTFEGISIEASQSPQERMQRVFGGRLKGEVRHRSEIQTLKIAGINVPEKPKEPDNCCMSGCRNCVWETYNEDLRHWNTKRKKAAASMKGTDMIWPLHWSPPLKLLDLRNIPLQLRVQKLKMDEVQKPDIKSLFPKRSSPLPRSVIEAKERNKARRPSSSMEETDEQEEDDGWEDIPIYIKVFAEFERKQRLLRREQKLKRRQMMQT
ncbi:hypothetical protein KAFR_0E00680 [Kazachstania africana CBS 2517]|uniref:Oxidoreductase-like domain-containing protein n=1 Tax=Kazachstania africana (strain ATCC 22294 / BCRC 22015 / CBS 2517 / CECT 1963 / NBRC 1671 / NRRL Y-8276) TaxID=1071382 RepID=H2AV22_KAZAF|nr:hypothetical protein KAFR_0E00680 [Kazachstania africana CBS 2517]CCF58222.1 hypothetical protein KAFR_0E00680 [Kazachstania africana CBS 2517]